MRKSFGANKNRQDKKKVPKESSSDPQTWEQYMEEGVLLEEKGERYATGDKAKRFYEKAGDMYNKACKLNPEDSDCLYNFGRVLYILVDFTHSACQKLSLLNASIERFRTALMYDPDNADTLFNLGQALTTHAEVIQDHNEDDEHHDHEHMKEDDDQGSPVERAALELQEAITLFENCYSIQQRELYASVQEAFPKNSSGKEEKPAESAVQELKELSSAAGALIDTLISSSQALTSLAYLVKTVERSQEYYRQAAGKLDIALGVGNDKLLWPAGVESSSSSKDKRKEATLELLLESESDEVLPATKPVSSFREAEPQSDTINQKEKISDIHLQYSAVYSSQAERYYDDMGKISEEFHEKALSHLDTVLSHRPRQVMALCDKGDLLGGWAQGLAELEKNSATLSDGELDRWDSTSTISFGTSDAVAAAEPTEASADGAKSSRPARIWQLFASATRAFLSALDVEPQNTSILEKLGDIHWSRSRLSSSVALKNRPTLLNNASVYYRYAWDSCKEATGDGVDLEQRLEVLLSWAQVLRAMPGRDEDVQRVLRQWKRSGGTKEMLKELLEDDSGDILQEDFIEFALKQALQGL
ncbi:hypothetical protein BGZ65_009945 [Modicella reniformis]|uniref:Uncharacterized protein n=1 Tax=Modicella reniformis TaxID=1440133 RepID=A0A9P6SQC9_9FUNG|nr:hypothetical protein BGZ65_009945 [Modicella reniformis]